MIGVLTNLFMENEPSKKQNTTTNNIEKKDEDKNFDKTKLKEISFWVVGRRKLQRVDSKSHWENQGDFFLCFHDALDQILIEHAFDIGFSKLAM